MFHEKESPFRWRQIRKCASAGQATSPRANPMPRARPSRALRAGATSHLAARSEIFFQTQKSGRRIVCLTKRRPIFFRCAFFCFCIAALRVFGGQNNFLDMQFFAHATRFFARAARLDYRQICPPKTKLFSLFLAFTALPLVGAQAAHFCFFHSRIFDLFGYAHIRIFASYRRLVPVKRARF